MARYLGGAFALYLVLEGVVPFLNPSAAQRWMAKLAQTETKLLRWGGGCLKYLKYALSGAMTSTSPWVPMDSR